MRAIIFSPYGNGTSKIQIGNPECNYSGAISYLHLLSAYLKTGKLEITKVICNGVCSICARDFNASIRSCNVCEKEQEDLASWSGIKKVSLGDYLNQEDLQLIEQQIRAGGSLRFSGHDLKALKEKFLPGIIQPETKIFQTLATIISGAKKVVRELKPDLVLLSSTEDFLVSTFEEVAKQSNLKVVSVNSTSSEIVLTKHYTKRSIKLPVYLNSLERIRPDTKSWPSEILGLIQDTAEFLDFSAEQLTLDLIR